MNLKLAKKIRQGMREMAGIERPGLQSDFQHPGPGRKKYPIQGRWQDDYEGMIPNKGDGTPWSTETTGEDGTKKLVPQRIVVVLKLASTRQVYKRAKRMVGA